MAINPLQNVGQVPIPTAQGLLGGVQAFQANETINALNQFNLGTARRKEAGAIKAAEQQEIFDAAFLMQIALASEDPQAAIKLVELGGVDTQEEQQLIQALQSGDRNFLDALKQENDQIVAAGFEIGALTRPDPISLVKGAELRSPTGELLAENVVQPDAPPTETFTGQPFSGIDEQGNPAQFIRGNQGTIRNIDIPPIDTTKDARIETSKLDNRLRFVGGTKDGELVFPDVEAPAAGEKGKPFASMGAENRLKLGLIVNANNLMLKAMPELFDEKGRHKGGRASVRGLDANLAKNDMREGLSSMLRAVSGAAIPPEEIAREVDAMLPDFNDTNDIARAKWNRAVGKVTVLHIALTGGFSGLPAELQFKDLTLPGQQGELTPRQQRIADLKAQLGES